MSIKLSDTQLLMLSAAAQRADRSLPLPEKLKGVAAQKVAMKLIAAGLVKEVKARAGMPVWWRDEQGGQSYALKLTPAGATAIAVDSDDAAHANDEERSREEQDQSPFAQSPCTAAAASAAPSSRALETPRAPRIGTKLAKAIELLQTTEGTTIAQLSEAMGWLPHTTRAVLTGLRKRGYALILDRSDPRRSSAYRIAVDANAAHAEAHLVVVEASSSAPIDDASESSASPVRPAFAKARRRSASTGTTRAA